MKRTVFALCAGFMVWLILAEFDIISRLYLPHPLDVVKSARIELLVGIVVTTARALIGFCIGIFLAYTVHLLSVATNTINALDSQFAASRAIPVVALMPLFILWFGFGETGRILIIILTGMAFFLAPLHNSFKDLPREWTLKKDILRLNVLQFYKHIVIPGTLSSLEGTYRLTMAVCFTIAIASDYMGAQVGLGKFIDTARITFNVPGIFLALFSSGITGLALDKSIQFFFRKIVHWSGKTSKA